MTDYNIELYFTEWGIYDRKYPVSKVPLDACPGISLAYAFVEAKETSPGVYGLNILDPWATTDKKFTDPAESVSPPDSWNDTVAFSGNFGQFLKLQKAGKQFNLSVSLGGWTKSSNISLAVRTSASRTSLVKSIIDFYDKYPIFNGFSLDWEYISTDGVNYGDATNTVDKTDGENCRLFLTELKQQLQATNRGNYKIALCLSADPKKIAAFSNFNQVHPLVDFIHLMTYDFDSGAWGTKTAKPHTNTYTTSYTSFSVDEAVKYVMNNCGCPSRKIMVGVAFYSRGYSGVTEPKLGAAATGGSTDKSWEDGVVDYHSLPLSGATEYYDAASGTAFSYDPAKQILNTYDSVQSVTEKCNYVKKNNLGGILVWEISGDTDINSNRSLLKTMYSILKSGKSVTPVPSVPSVPQPKPTPVPSMPSAPVQPTPTTPSGPSLAPWVSGTSYKAGDLVSYNGKTYICITSHISNVSWTPTAAFTLWKEQAGSTPSVPVQPALTPTVPSTPSVPKPAPIPPPKPTVPSAPSSSNKVLMDYIAANGGSISVSCMLSVENNKVVIKGFIE
jgi:chitinase